MENLNHDVIKMVCPEAEDNVDFHVIMHSELSSPELIWLSKTLPRPTDEALIIAAAENKAKEDAKAYIAQRQAEYPQIHEYMDAIVKGDIDAQQAYIDKCLAIKSKYPKPV